MQRGVLGGVVGYVAARIGKHFALSTFKLSVFGIVLYIGAAALGYIGRDPADIVEKLHDGASRATSAIAQKMDINGDGKVDGADLKVLVLPLIFKISTAAALLVASNDKTLSAQPILLMHIANASLITPLPDQRGNRRPVADCRVAS